MSEDVRKREYDTKEIMSPKEKKGELVLSRLFRLYEPLWLRSQNIKYDPDVKLLLFFRNLS